MSVTNPATSPYTGTTIIVCHLCGATATTSADQARVPDWGRIGALGGWRDVCPDCWERMISGIDARNEKATPQHRHDRSCTTGPRFTPAEPLGTHDGFSTCTGCNNDVWVGYKNENEGEN